MENIPPPVLVQTWLFIARNQNDYEFSEKQLSVRRELKRIFGSMELAQLYVDKAHEEELNTHYV